MPLLLCYVEQKKEEILMIELVGGMLTQWDIDRSVEIADSLSVDEVHFANEGDSIAVKIQVTEVDGKKTAAIPCYLLQSGKSVRAYGVNGGVTVKVISFPVRKRERPADYVYEDDQRNYIYRLISDAKDATEKANAVADELYKAKENGEFKGEKGEKGDKGDKGDPTPLDDSTIGTESAWSSKNTVDKLCPSFSKSGSIVTCEPLEGYPLNITAEGATKITRCGKNLLNDRWKTWSEWYEKRFLLNLPAGNYAISAAKPAKETYLYLEKSVDSGSTWTEHGKILANTTARTITFTVVDGEKWSLWTSKESYLASVDSLQIEVGSTKTDYEPFRGNTFGVGEPVPAIAGINCIYADTGSVTVHGKADPVAIIEKLTNAIVSLGGNI